MKSKFLYAILFSCFYLVIFLPSVHAEQTLEDGHYVIRSAANPTQAFSSLYSPIHSRVFLTGYTLSDRTIWNIEYDRTVDGYRISEVIDSRYSQKNKRYINRHSSGILTLELLNEKKDKVFKINKTNDGYYNLASYNGNLVAEANFDSSVINSSKKYDATNQNQKFDIKPYDYQPVNDGLYRIKSKKDPNMVLDLSENKDGALVHAHPFTGAFNQLWQFSYDPNKRAYKIYNFQNRNYVLTVDRNIKDGTPNVKGYKSNSNDDKFWILEKSEDGTYQMANLYTKYVYGQIFERLIFTGNSNSLGGKSIHSVEYPNQQQLDILNEWIIEPY